MNYYGFCIKKDHPNISNLKQFCDENPVKVWICSSEHMVNLPNNSNEQMEMLRAEHYHVFFEAKSEDSANNHLKITYQTIIAN